MEVKFVRMVSISAIERVHLRMVLAVFRSSDEKGGYIQLITWNLEPAHQVTPECIFVTLLWMASRTQ